MKKIVNKIFKITGLVILSIIALVVLVLGGLNIAKFAIYSEYYSIEESVCKNPGLSDGFVCQGIAADEENEVIIVSGYMKDDSDSRIYVTDLDSNSYYVNLKKEGKSFTGHCGGVAISHDVVYIASGSKIYTLSLDTLLNANNGDDVEIGSGIKVETAASYVYTDENYLYVGEFHDGGKYVTDHIYNTAEGENHAIIVRYDINDLSTPNKVYSIRNKVQGVCFTPDGKVVLSTSYGLASSYYYVYNESEATLSEHTFANAPVYYLDNCVNEIKGPAMAEDLDYYNGKVITLSESASDKYIFGKFFFANKIVSLDI